MNVTLQDIMEITCGSLVKEGNQAIFQGISIDSRTIQRSNLFVTIKGVHFDGNDFVSDALHKGVSGLVDDQCG